MAEDAGAVDAANKFFERSPLDATPAPVLELATLAGAVVDPNGDCVVPEALGIANVNPVVPEEEPAAAEGAATEAATLLAESDLNNEEAVVNDNPDCDDADELEENRLVKEGALLAVLVIELIALLPNNPGN